MTLIHVIKQDQLAARKEGNKDDAQILTTLIGEAEMVGKNNGNRAPADEEVIKVVERFIKAMEETRDHVSGEKRININREIDTLERYLPTPLTEDELRSEIHYIVHDLGATSVKHMGSVMKALKQMHAGRYDGKLASEIVKEKLA